MILIQKREWGTGTAQSWVSWAVRWLDDKQREHMRLFDNWIEAEAFFEQKLARRTADQGRTADDLSEAFKRLESLDDFDGSRLAAKPQSTCTDVLITEELL